MSYENVNTTSIVLLTFEDGDSAAVSTSEAEEKIQDKKTEGVELVSRQIVM